MIQLWRIVFQRGWFNHQLDKLKRIVCPMWTNHFANFKRRNFFFWSVWKGFLFRRKLGESRLGTTASHYRVSIMTCFFWLERMERAFFWRVEVPDDIFQAVFFMNKNLGGGCKHFWFTPFPGEIIQFDKHIFDMDWFNHQLDIHHLSLPWKSKTIKKKNMFPWNCRLKIPTKMMVFSKKPIYLMVFGQKCFFEKQRYLLDLLPKIHFSPWILQRLTSTWNWRILLMVQKSDVHQLI